MNEEQQKAIELGRSFGHRRKRCVICKRLSYFTHQVNGGPPECFDGHFSTTGRDHRTIDGKPDGKLKGEVRFGSLI